MTTQIAVKMTFLALKPDCLVQNQLINITSKQKFKLVEITTIVFHFYSHTNLFIEVSVLWRCDSLRGATNMLNVQYFAVLGDLNT